MRLILFCSFFPCNYNQLHFLDIVFECRRFSSLLSLDLFPYLCLHDICIIQKYVYFTRICLLRRQLFVHKITLHHNLGCFNVSIPPASNLYSTSRCHQLTTNLGCWMQQITWFSSLSWFQRLNLCFRPKNGASDIIWI